MNLSPVSTEKNLSPSSRSPLRNMLNYEIQEPCDKKDQVIRRLSERLGQYLHVNTRVPIAFEDNIATPIHTSPTSLKALAHLVENTPKFTSYRGKFESPTVDSALNLLSKNLTFLLSFTPQGEASPEEKDFLHAIYKTALKRRLLPLLHNVHGEKTLILAPLTPLQISSYAIKKLNELIQQTPSLQRVYLNKNIEGKTSSGFYLNASCRIIVSSNEHIKYLLSKPSAPTTRLFESKNQKR